MIKNIQITKKGNEANNSQKTIFSSPSSWEENGANLVLYKNSTPLVADRDYEVQDPYTIKLLSAAKTSDELNFIITQIIDPSEMLSHDERMQQLDKIDKKMEGKAQTSIDKRAIEETIPSKFIIHSQDIWTSNISNNVAEAQQEHTAIPVYQLILEEDVTVAHKKGWFATNDGDLSGRITDWIPPNFGNNYIIRLFDSMNNEIPSSDSMNWRWDYQAGYLVIENDFEYETPFKVTGFKYDGRYGVGSLTNWKEPVFSVADFPIYHNDDGDIRLVRTENKFYRFDSLANKWDPLNYGSSSFRDPVINVNSLSQINNMRGDIRLVLDESNLYVWDDTYGPSGSWILLTGQGFDPSNYYDKTESDILFGGKANTNHTHDTLYLREGEVKDLVRWRPPRDDFGDLPPYTENRDGDVILTKDNNTIWRWYTDDPNTGQGHWDAIVQSNFSWKTPVMLVSELPSSNNSPGDTRLIISEEKIYFWTGVGWLPVVADVSEHHHDNRYLLKTSLNWKQPIDTFANLPTAQNVDGDCRITLDENIIYRWVEAGWEWVEVIQKSSWLDPVLLMVDLPATANDNDIIYVKEYNQLYVWDGVWTPIETAVHDHNDLYYTEAEIDILINNTITQITTHTHDGIDSTQIDYNNLLNIPTFYWKNPVVFEIDLPLTDNTIGDARIVIDAKTIYVWTGIEWEIISGGNFNSGHPHTEFYTKSEVDQLLSNMQITINNQLATKADINHDHNDDYYSKIEVDIALSGKAETVHTHNMVHDHDGLYPTFSELSQSGGGGDVHWDNITNKPSSVSDAWKTPVQTETNLPSSGNDEGDLRLVLETSDVWRWDSLDWINIGHWQGPQVDHWEAPVAEKFDLPFTGNFDGDIRLVKEENKLYRWDEMRDEWMDMCCGDETPGPDPDPEDDGFTFEEIQVYFNGLQGIEGEDWEKTSTTSLRILADVDVDDIISILVIGSSLKRYDFRGTGEGSFEINLATTFFRKELELSVPTSLFTLPVPYNPGQKDLVVWLNGMIQRVDEDYTELSTTEFLFNRMLDIGDRLIIVIFGFASGEENYVREDYTATDDQRTYNLIHEFVPGVNQLLVYFNGQLQLNVDDYEEIDSNTIRFVNEREVKADDFITFIILKGLAIGGPGTGGCCEYATDIMLGIPSDGSWTDGYVTLYSDMTVTDAIDELNEALLELIPDDLVSLEDAQLDSEDVDFVSGFVSDGNDYIEGQPGDYFDYLTKDREFFLHTPEESFTKADQGIIRLFVNGVESDSFNLGDAFVEGDRNGFQTANHYGIASQGALDNVGLPGTNGAIRNSTNGFIQILSVQKFGYRRIQRGHIRFKFYNGLLRHGYNYIYATHSYDGVVNTTRQFKLFIDTKHVFPAFTGTQTLFEQVISSQKYISGVRYYSIGDSFRTTFNITNLAYTVYSAEIVEYDMPGLKPVAVEYNDTNLNISDPPHIDDIAIYQNIFVLDEFNEFSIDGVVTIKTATPFGPGEEYTFISKNRLINTYTNGSTQLVEYFRDEIFRMPTDDYDIVPIQKSYIWDSTQPLNSDEVLLFDKGLRYANMSFIDYLPAQTVDYSGFTGPQTYYRCFVKNIPKNNGHFILTGITKNELLINKILIDIKLPTQTGWLSLNKYYEISEFDGEDGDGCLIDIVDDKFYYSSGTFSTAYSGYTIVIRITLPDDSAPVLKYLELKW